MLRTLTLTCFGLALLPLATQAQEAPDYNNMSAWVCHPDNPNDACDRDLTTTAIAADGSMSVQTWPENDKPEIDCFYVYPTTSMDEAGNSDLIANEQGEKITAYLQTARFRSECRVFAPLYRQVTVPALRRQFQGNFLMAYGDALNAWKHYLANDNNGRGVVIIGHSQGASLMLRLLAEEIDGKPVQKQLVSAILSGTSVQVPAGKTVGGSLKNIPICEKADQTGCVITFSSYRSTMPPPAGALFGRNTGDTKAACTNPAALGGGEAELKAHLSTAGEISTSFQPYPEWVKGKTVETPFASLPGMLYSECVEKDGYSYLEIRIKGDASDPRLDDLTGDVYANGEINKGWGLHLLDMSLTMGNLVDIVAQQANAYAK